MLGLFARQLSRNLTARSCAAVPVRFAGDASVKDPPIPKPPVAEPETIFDKIIRKQIPADIIYEDEQCLAFNDVAPQGPVHFLVIPKRRIAKLEDGSQADVQIFGHLLQVAGRLGKSKAPQGFRLVINNGDHGCQTVYHLHLHVIGGRQLGWPPG